MKTRSIPLVILGLSLCLATAIPLRAQLNRGTLEGIVTDPQGAAIPNANVVVKSGSTNVSYPTKTDAAGYYRVVDLVPGKYSAHFEVTGFSATEVANINVTAAQVSRVDAQMKLGPTQQTVTVTSQSILLDTTPANFSSNVESRAIQDMPLEGRDLMQMIFLIPGVNSVGGPPGSNFGFNSQFTSLPDPSNVVGSSLAVNGGQAGANAWYVDGNLDLSSWAENVVINPSPDSVDEFQAVTSGLGAQYSRTGGGVFNVVLKSGTNALHGDLYGYQRQSGLSARNPFTSVGPTGGFIPSRENHFDTFGGTIGGPVVIPKIFNGRNKTFFFFSDDIHILHILGDTVFNVPTALERIGDFSEVPNAASLGIWNPYSSVGPDPNTGNFDRTAFGTPVAGNPFGANGCLASSVSAGTQQGINTCNFATSIPSNMINPIAQQFMNNYPLPNFNSPTSTCPVGAGGYKICGNYLGWQGTSQDGQNILVKIDENWSNKSRFIFEYFYNPSSYRQMRAPWTGISYPAAQVGFGSEVPADVHNQVISVGNTYTFNPTTINEFHYSFSRQFLNTSSALTSLNTIAALPQAKSLFAPVQIPVANSYIIPSMSIGLPVGGSLPTGFPGYSLSNNMSEAHTFTDDLTKIIGRHTLKAGVMYRLDHATWEGNEPTPLNFYGGITGNPYTGLGAGGGLSQFLLGAIGTGDGDFAGPYNPGYQSWKYWGFYVQDDFRVTRNFSLNIGLREDIYGWDYTRYHPQSTFCTTCVNPLTPQIKGTIIYDGTSMWPSGAPESPAMTNNVWPRVNFSYSPSWARKFVIRGGWDIFTSDATDLASAPGQWGMPGWYYGGGWTQSANPTQCASLSAQCVAWSFNDTTTNKYNLLFPQPSPLPAQTKTPGFGTEVSTLERNPTPRVPTTQMWNLEIQRELPGNTLLTVGYVGNRGTHLFGEGFRNIDYVPTADLMKYQNGINALAPIAQYYSGQTAATLESVYGSSQLPLSKLLTPIPSYNGGVYMREYDATSIFHAMNVRLEKRFSHGLNMNVVYSVSKNLTNDEINNTSAFLVDPIHFSGLARTGYVTGNPDGYYQDPDHRVNGHMLAPYDIPQTLDIFGSYTLPFGSGKAFLNQKGIVNGLFGGWQVTGHFNAESGIPLIIGCPQSTLQAMGPNGASNCNLIGNPSQFSGGRSRSQKIAQWLNPAAFQPAFGGDQTFWANYTPTDPRAWQFGNADTTIPSARAPGFWNLDAALFKNFKITESKSFQFRWEVFNALNHMNLGTPNTGWCLPPTASGETDRVHQAGCGFGLITNIAEDPRSLQFSLKFLW